MLSDWPQGGRRRCHPSRSEDRLRHLRPPQCGGRQPKLRGDEELLVRVEGFVRTNEPFITVQAGHVVRKEQDGVVANGLHYAYVEYRTDSLPSPSTFVMRVVRAKPIAHPEAHQQHDEKVGHTDLMQGLHVLTC